MRVLQSSCKKFISKKKFVFLRDFNRTVSAFVANKKGGKQCQSIPGQRNLCYDRWRIVEADARGPVGSGQLAVGKEKTMVNCH